MTPTLIEIFNRAIDSGTWLSQELLAELVHPDPTGDMPDVRRAFKAHDEALSELTAELQIMRN